MELLIPQNRNLAARGKFGSFSKSGGRRKFLYFISGLVLAFCLTAVPARAQTASHEYPLKAVFLLNFARFTDWPTNAFESPDAPFVIGILGSDPFGEVMDETVRDEQANGRKFVVERYRSIEDVKNCHILFISQSESQRLDKITAALKGKPILTVSDIEGAAYRGVCVRFLTANNKIRLRINTGSLKDANLTMSSQLLRVAELVPAPPK